MFKKDPLKSKRIFVGFNSAGAAGIYSWTRVLRRRGYKVDFYGRYKQSFNMPVDVFINPSKNKLIAQFQQALYFLKILFKYDIWHFNALNTFFAYPVNLLILKLFGKKIIHTYRGSEIRLSFDFLPKSLVQKPVVEPWPPYYQNWEIKDSLFRKLSKFSRRIKMRFFRLVCKRIVVIGPFLSASVNSYDKVIPYSRAIGPKQKFVNKKKLLVIHSPTNPEIKGTAYIEKVFRKLSRKYPEHQFLITEKMDFEKIQKVFERADIVVDQLLVGWYGGTCVEAMSKGKIAVAYIHQPYLNLIPFGREVPVVNSNIWSLERDLETLLDSPKLREKLSLEGYKFVKKYHSDEVIAQQYLEIYKETIK